MSVKPVMVAGKKKPFIKCGKMATNPCPEIYAISLNHASGYSDGFHVVHCLSSKNLKELWTQDFHPAMVEPVTGETFQPQNLSEIKIYNNQLFCCGFGLTNVQDDAPTLTRYDLGLSPKDVILRDAHNGTGSEHWPGFYDVVALEDGHKFVLTYDYEYKADPGAYVTVPRILCYPKDQPPAWNNTTTYAVGAKVLYDYKTWQSLAAASGHTPEEGEWWTTDGILAAEAKVDGPQETYWRKIAGQFETDGVFRLYAIGYCGATTGDDSGKDVVYRWDYDFDAKTFTGGKVFVDSPAMFPDLLTANAGRGYELFVPKALDSTQKTCYYISMIVDDTTPTSPQYARVAVITDDEQTYVQDVMIFTGSQDWDEDLRYDKDTWVIYDDEYWKSKQNENTGHTPAAGDWWEAPITFTEDYTYLIGDVALYGDGYYEGPLFRCLEDTSLNASGKYIENYNAAHTYNPGDCCRHDSKIWYTPYTTLAHLPGDEEDPGWWSEATESQYAPSSTYGSTRWEELTWVMVGYYGILEDVFAGWPDYGARESIQAALRYINGCHHLYFRGSSNLFPAQLFDFNLTTETYTLRDTISLSSGKKPKLMGVPCSITDPYHFDKIIMMTRTDVYMVSLDDLTTILYSINIDDIVQSKRPGYSSYINTFIASRINQRLKSTD